MRHFSALLVVTLALAAAAAGGSESPGAPRGNVSLSFWHTTDVHGWVNGHPHLPGLDATYGDFYSFLEHTWAQSAAEKRVEVLFDTGDVVDGTGLSDATPIHGQYIFPTFRNISFYNGLTNGNHDLGHPKTIPLLTKFARTWANGTYMTSNTRLASTGEPISESNYTVVTHGGVRMLLLGYIFNFTHEAPSTRVVAVQRSVQQDYFKAAMAEDVDMICVLAHIAPQLPTELRPIYEAIRAVRPTTPLILFSGHSHMEYWEHLDDQGWIIESGKYFQEIGHITLQFDLDANVMRNVQHEFIPTSRKKFMELTGTDESSFPTAQGEAISAQLQRWTHELGLDTVLGCSPLTYSPYVGAAANNSLYALYVNGTARKMLLKPSASRPQIFMTNRFSLRNSLYKGNITYDDVVKVSPFHDLFYRLGPLSGAQLLNVLSVLNGAAPGALPPPRSPAHAALHHAVSADAQAAQRLGESLPSYYVSDMPDASAKAIDLIAPAYDADITSQLLVKLYGGDWPLHGYLAPGGKNYTDTIMLRDYVDKYMKKCGKKKNPLSGLLAPVIIAVALGSIALVAIVIYFLHKNRRPAGSGALLVEDSSDGVDYSTFDDKKEVV